MNYAQRNTWTQLVAMSLGVAIYLAIVLPQLATRAPAEVAWQWPMIWTCVGAIAASIASSILWGIVAGMIDRDEEHAADHRDREIGWYGDRVGQAFAIAGGLGALVLTMLQAHWFWIGNALYLGFFLAAFAGAVARLAAYRRGTP
ncbi:MAG: hypothetical protein DI534_14130 [Leifsonia xyli]|nr:MAG: hypothetical protein DI534_14130 [Leifsonia xyli]